MNARIAEIIRLGRKHPDAPPPPGFPLRDLGRWPRHERIRPSSPFSLRLVATKPVAAVLVFFVGLLATAEESRLIFEDDFERYTNTAAFRAIWPQGAVVLELHSPGGGQAARHDGGDANHRGGFSVLPSLAHNVVLTADLFDFGTNANKHVTVALHYRKGAWLEIRPAPQCPWWPYVWSQQTRVRVGDDGKVPVGPNDTRLTCHPALPSSAVSAQTATSTISATPQLQTPTPSFFSIAPSSKPIPTLIAHAFPTLIATRHRRKRGLTC